MTLSTPPLYQPSHPAGIVDRPDANVLAAAVGRAQHFIGQAVRPDTQCFDLQPADVSQGFADDDPCSQMRILSFALQEGVVIEGRDKAIGLEVLFADQASHRPGQSSIRAKGFQLNVQLDPSACQVDDLATYTEHAPWYGVPSHDKRRARLSCISHLLGLIPYKKLPRKKVQLPERSTQGSYDDRATLEGRRFVKPRH